MILSENSIFFFLKNEAVLNLKGRKEVNIMKNKKMLLIAGVLAAFLMLAVPFTVASVDSEDVDAADTGPVAMIGDNSYDTLEGAINASTAGQTIKIMKNVDIQSGISVSNSDVIIDLNGKTISGICGSSQAYIFMVNNGAQLTIKDSSDSSTGKITYAGNNSTGWIVDVEGELILDSGTLELTGTWNIGYAVDVRPNAWGTPYTEPTVFIMNGGKITSSDGAVRVASSSSDGSPNENGGHYVNYSNISATFIMNGGEIDAEWDGVFIQQSDVEWDKLSFTINDGDIKSDLNPIRLYGPAPTSYVDGEDCINIALNGGTLTYTGTEDRTWLIDGIIRTGGGATEEDFVNDSLIVVNGFVLVNDVSKLSAALDNENVSEIELQPDFRSPDEFTTVTVHSSVEIDGSNVIVNNIRFNIGYNNQTYTDAPIFSGNVTLKNLYITNATDSGNVNRAVSVMFTDDVDLNIIGCRFDTVTYAINVTTQCNSIDIEIDNSGISGYCAFQTWADSTVLTIKESTLTGKNVSSGNYNGFATIVVNVERHANITIEDSGIFTTEVDDIATEMAIVYRGLTTGTLSLKNVEFGSLDKEGNSKPSSIIIGPEGDYFNENIVLEEFDASSAVIEIKGSLNGIESFYIPEGSSISIAEGSVLSCVVNGPNDNYVVLNNIKAGAKGILIEAGSLTISGDFESNAQGAAVGVQGDDINLYGTINSGVSLITMDETTNPNVPSGKTLTFESDSSALFAGNNSITGEGTTVYNTNVTISTNNDTSTGATPSTQVITKPVKIENGSAVDPFEITLVTYNGVITKNGVSTGKTSLTVYAFPGDSFADVLEDYSIESRWYSSYTVIWNVDLNDTVSENVTIVGECEPDSQIIPPVAMPDDSASEGMFDDLTTADYATIVGIAVGIVMVLGLFCIVRRN